jgi:hypothetical protein
MNWILKHIKIVFLRKKCWYATLLFSLIILPSFSQEEFIKNQLIVWLNDGFNQKQLLNFEKGNPQGFDIIQQLSPKYPIYLLEFKGDVNVKNIQKEFNAQDLFKWVQPNHTNLTLRSESVIPNDPRFNLQWHLKNTGQQQGSADIAATEAWSISTGGFTRNNTPIFIGIVDDGYELTHEDIDFFVNENEIPNNGIDDDNNGYIDDYEGWNAYNNSGNMSGNDIENRHGTRVSGVIAAKSDNGLGVTGVDWGVNVIPVKGSSAMESTVVAAYAYLLQWRELFNETKGEQGAFVVAVNSSFGVDLAFADDYPIWCEMYSLMGDAGIINVAATSNRNRNVDLVGDMPSNCTDPLLIAVTSSNSLDERNATGWGVNSVNIAAPGSLIHTVNINNTYINGSGTSFAAPQVTGAISLMWSVACENLLTISQENPREAATRIKDLLLNQGVDKLQSFDGFVSSGGRLNLFKAVSAAENLTCLPRLNLAEDAPNIFPNPVKGNFVLNPAGLPAAVYEIDYLNVKGQLIKSGGIIRVEPSGAPINLYFKPESKGVYFLRISGNGQQKLVKFVATR